MFLLPDTNHQFSWITEMHCFWVRLVFLDSSLAHLWHQLLRMQNYCNDCVVKKLWLQGNAYCRICPLIGEGLPPHHVQVCMSYFQPARPIVFTSSIWKLRGRNCKQVTPCAFSPPCFKNNELQNLYIHNLPVIGPQSLFFTLLLLFFSQKACKTNHFFVHIIPL